LRASREHPSHRYRLVDTHVALHGKQSSPGTLPATLHFPAEHVAVYPASALAKATGRAFTGPVYQSHEGGSLAVPTGAIYVRVAAPSKLADRKAQLRAAGYRIAKTLPYAPQAGWVAALDGDLATALNNIDKLDAIDGVEEVAPEMLSKAARKG
jgi:hypothetical protein